MCQKRNFGGIPGKANGNIQRLAIKQWGFADSNRSVTVTYPISFPSRTLRVIPVVQMNGRNSGYDRSPFYINTTSKSSFTTANAGDALTWLALGN